MVDSSAFLSLRGRDGSETPLDEAQRYLSAVQQVLRTRATAAGMRAYLAVVLREAQAAAPSSIGGLFQSRAGYRTGVRSRGGSVVGFLHSAGYGNVLEAGYAGHYAPIDDSVGSDGTVSPGLGAWLRVHNPALLAQWGAHARFARVKSRAATPWVIPAAERAEGAAASAFESAIVDSITKEVK